MADDARDVWELTADGALQRIDPIMRHFDRDRWIDPTMEDDEMAVGGRANAHVVNIAQHGAARRIAGQRGANRRGERGFGFAAADLEHFQGLDMRLDFDVGAEFVLDGGFELRRDIVRVGEGHAPVDFEIERHRGPLANLVDGDMVHEEPPPRGDQLHPLQHRFVIERQRVGGERQRRLRPSAGDRIGDVGFDRRDALERQRARDEQAKVADGLRAAAT